MNCDICHKDTTAGSHVNRGRYFEVHICPSCLMWSDDLRAALYLTNELLVAVEDVYGERAETGEVKHDSNKRNVYAEKLL